MIEIKKIIRKNILTLSPYSSARDECKLIDGIFLDANENPYEPYNRYPDPYQKILKEKLAKIKNTSIDTIFIGNGSDEIIDLVFRVFCTPQKSKAIICPPTYGMYEVLARINDIDIITIPLKNDFQLNIDKILKSTAQLLFICSPNNPTGNNLNDLESIIEHFQGIVFVDEAYIDFSKRPSLISKINQYKNLIVSQTLSKAWGKAAIRIGTAFAHKEIINYFNKVKNPYNVSQLNQNEAVKALENLDNYKRNIKKILSEKKRMLTELAKLNFIEKIYPSDANFILVKTKNANLIYEKLIANKIIVRNRNTILENCLRITIGKKTENSKLLHSLKNITL